MKTLNYKKGKAGEEIAAEFLRKKGFKILEQNFNTRYGELDLICVDKNILVFTEVKLKVGEQFGTPEEMVNRRKLYQIEQTAQSFLLQNPEYKSRYASYRIDVVAVVVEKSGLVERIDHYENVSF